MRRIVRMAYTECRDGITVSTLHIEGLGQYGGDFETALLTPSWADDVERYEDGAAALSGHARYVRQHGGAAGFCQRLFG